MPVILLASWVQSDALEKEVRSVTEKHLLIARNLSGALERYVTDVRATFRVASYNGHAGQELDGLDELAHGAGHASLRATAGGDACALQSTSG